MIEGLLMMAGIAFVAIVLRYYVFGGDKRELHAIIEGKVRCSTCGEVMEWAESEIHHLHCS